MESVQPQTESAELSRNPDRCDDTSPQIGCVSTENVRPRRPVGWKVDS
jgi:hypothetical protein